VFKRITHIAIFLGLNLIFSFAIPDQQTLRDGIKMNRKESELLYITGGEFEMGISKEQADSLYNDFFPPESEVNPSIFYNEVPNHKIRVAAFNVSKYEVTNREFKEFVDDGGYTKKELWKELLTVELSINPVGWDRIELFKDSTGATGPSTWVNGTYKEGKADHPVDGVSWFEAMAYCRWKHYRLPAEAEWEYSARGTDQRMFPWGNSFDVINNWGARQAAETSPVGSIQEDKSPFGVLDLSRNVAEWVGDVYAPYPGSPLGQLEKLDEEYGVLRGGMYTSIAYQMRTTARQRHSRMDRGRGIGFRCAK
jgi:formylglycine-generating enzyme required for sulfatase activity